MQEIERDEYRPNDRTSGQRQTDLRPPAVNGLIDVAPEMIPLELPVVQEAHNFIELLLHFVQNVELAEQLLLFIQQILNHLVDLVDAAFAGDSRLAAGHRE